MRRELPAPKGAETLLDTLSSKNNDFPGVGRPQVSCMALKQPHSHRLSINDPPLVFAPRRQYGQCATGRERKADRSDPIIFNSNTTIKRPDYVAHSRRIGRPAHAKFNRAVGPKEGFEAGRSGAVTKSERPL